MKVCRTRVACLSAAVAAITFGGLQSHARDLTWDSDPATAGVQDGDGTWEEVVANTNWLDGATNVTWDSTIPDSALIGGTTATVGTGINTISLVSAITVQNLAIGNGANGNRYNITDNGGGSLTLAGNVDKFSGGNGGGNPTIAINGSMTLAPGQHTFAINDTGGDAAPELTITGFGGIGGSGGITMDNGTYVTWGSLALVTDNTYTGATNINKGRLIIATNTALGDSSTGTTIANLGTLSIGGANQTATSLTLNEPITITRNTYTQPESEYDYAFISQGGTGTHTLQGGLIVDSTDARLAVNSSRVVIPGPITQGATIGPDGLGKVSFTGDFAGFVELQGDNSALKGGFEFRNGVEVQATSQANIGGPNSTLNFVGDATLGIMNGFMTDFGTHVVNYGSFSGGLNIPAGQTFSLTQPITGGAGLGKRGTGTLNFNAAMTATGNLFYDGGIVNINAPVQMGAIRLRSPIVNIPTGGTLTTTSAFSSIGVDSAGTNGGPDKATINITGGSMIVNSTADFNVSDNANTEGTINLSAGTLSVAGLMHVGRSTGATGKIVQTGGQFTLTRTGDFTLVLGSRRGTGIYELSGGTMTSAGQFYVGQGDGANFGTGSFTMSGGVVNISNTFAVGREGGLGTVDISGGTINKTGGANTYIDQFGNGTNSKMTIRGTGTLAAAGGEFWVGRANGGNGTLIMQDAGVLTTNNWTVVARNAGEGPSTGTLTMSGTSSITKQTGTGNHFIFGDGAGSNATATLSDSASITVTAGQTWIAQNAATAVVTLNGSSELKPNDWLAIGRSDNNTASNGTLNLGDNAKLTKTGGGNVVIAGGGNTTGLLNQTGGTFTNTGSETWITENGTSGTWNMSGGTATLGRLDVGRAGGGTAVLNLSGTAALNAGIVRLGQTGAITSTANLNGGTLTATQLIGGAGTGNRSVNFNGGTLKAATGADPAFMQGLTAANIQNGGAIIDSNGQSVTIAQPLVGGASTGGLTKNGAGTVSLSAAANVYNGATTVNDGTLALADTGSKNNVLNGGALSIATAAKLDLTNNKLITTSPLGSATGGTYNGVAGEVQRANAGGTWTGNGLTTSLPAAASGLTSIGTATGAQLKGLGVGQTASFAGQTITNTSTVAMYTYAGDANMDGFISGDDYSAIDFNIAVPGATGWFNGDFNYDGIISGDDYSAIDFNIVAQGTPFPTSGSAGASAGLSGVTAVPEPASISLVALAASSLLGRRRRRQQN